jgi:hypothetical protein
MLESLVMARRPFRDKEEILTEEQLKRIQNDMALLNQPAVEERYEKAWQDCRLIYKRFPSARSMQLLVTIWKLLRKWRH